MQFQTVKEKQYHVRSKHGPDESSEECPVCHKTYNKMYLKEHLATHDENSVLNCIECGKKFSSKSNLNKHRKKHLPGYVPAKDKQREKKYGCSECGKKFDSMHGLEVCRIYIISNQCRYLSTCAPTPPLTQHLPKPVGLGMGRCGSVAEVLILIRYIYIFWCFTSNLDTK